MNDHIRNFQSPAKRNYKKIRITKNIIQIYCAENILNEMGHMVNKKIYIYIVLANIWLIYIIYIENTYIHMSYIFLNIFLNCLYFSGLYYLNNKFLEDFYKIL